MKQTPWCFPPMPFSQSLFGIHQERQRTAAAVHIQRITRGRAARTYSASTGDSSAAPISSLQRLKTPPGDNQTEVDSGFSPKMSTEFEDETDGDAGGAPETSMLLSVDRGCAKTAISLEGGGETQGEDDSSTPADVEHGDPGAPVGDEGRAYQQDASSTMAMSELVDSAREHAASSIQVQIVGQKMIEKLR